MSSLKGFIPALARLLGSSPSALYERQRALVRAGLLTSESSQSRGPGSGVRATAPAVAMLLIAVLATDNLSETEERATAVASGELQANKPPFTHLPKFKDALAAILMQEGLCRQIEEVRVSRTAGRALVRFKKTSKFSAAVFEFGIAGGAGVLIEASIGADILRQINHDLDAIIESSAEDPK